MLHDRRIIVLVLQIRQGLLWAFVELLGLLAHGFAAFYNLVMKGCKSEK